MPCCKIHPRTMSVEEQERELDGDPLDLLPTKELLSRSEVASFYDGAAVLITGATGFLGTSLLEKLLRTCRGISTIYVLVRDKKGVPLRERVHTHLETPFFSKMREACPDYSRKVVPVAADLSKPGLGLSTADADELASKVSIIFNVAATVRFDEGLRVAALTNVASTCYIISLARRMPNLKAFLHVSTAYANCPLSNIEEKFYPPPLTTEEVLKLASTMDDEQLSQVLPKVLGDWPNTYSFTKAIAEDTVRVRAHGLPAAIIRPSIVMCTAREPVAQWVNNVYGPIGVVAGAGLGLMRVCQVDNDAKAEIVPVDLVTNASIACAWDTWWRHNQQPAAEPVIYNFVSSMRHPITWREFMHHTEHGVRFPSVHSIWYYFLFLVKEKWKYDILTVFVHLIPALIMDTGLRLSGKQPMLWKVYQRMHRFTGVLSRFTTNEWSFEEANILALLRRLGPVDHKLFPFDITEVDWEYMLCNSTRGIRLYLAADNFDTLEVARKKFARLKFLHYSLCTIYSALLILLVWRLFFA